MHHLLGYIVRDEEKAVKERYCFFKHSICQKKKKKTLPSTNFASQKLET